MTNMFLPISGMKVRFCLCFAILFLWGLSLSVQAQTSSLTKVPINTRSSNIKGYIEYLPPNYDASGATKYPVLYWLHGLGEDVGGGTSASLENLLNGQIAHWLKTHDVGFIVLMPQDFSGYWNGGTNGIKQFVDWANGYYQNVIDVNQQHMAGLSSGGYGIRDFIIGNTTTYQAFATFTPMSTNLNQANNKVSQIVANNQYVWIHHNTGDTDPNALTSVTPFHNALYALDNTRSRITAYNEAGHNAWEKVYNGSGRSVQQRTGTVSGTTYYNWTLSDPDGDWFGWMLSHGKVTAPAPPVVNAGSDASITLPTNTLTLNGSATTPSGTSVTGYAWTKLSGPTATIASPTAASTALTGLVEGVYVFRLTVTNSAGLSAHDDVTVTVIQIPTPPVVRTGVFISASAGSVRFMGSVTDDGSITSYSWTKISGPACTLQNTQTAVLTVSGFTAGTYVFGLTTTDDDNLSASAEVILFVEASTAQTVAEADNSQAVDLFKTLTPGTDVMIFNARQEKVFQGTWDASRFQDVFSGEGLYMYHIITNGQRSTGKLYIKR